MYTVVTDKNPNADLPDWIKNSNKEVLSTKILWKFRSESEAAEAVEVFHDSGFEYVHRTSSF